MQALFDPGFAEAPLAAGRHHPILASPAASPAPVTPVGPSSALGSLLDEHDCGMMLLCEGLEPRDIAQTKQVGMCTVRTQVYSIRLKTATHSIRELLRRLVTLPPITSSLRV